MREDLTASMRARDEVRTSTLRMALTSIKSAEVAGTSARDLSQDEVMAVLRSEVKKRREAAEAFAGAGRAESAERERAEEAVLATYLPQQMPELSAVVAEEVAAAAAAGKTGPGAMGAVMGAVKPRVGALAEGGRVAAEVRRQLAG
jgi:uncharacterized protein YqeY